MALTVLALDIGATKLAAGVVHADRLLRVRRVAVPPESVWQACRELLAAFGDARIDAVGIGSAGPVDARSGIVAPLNIPAWRSGFSLVAAVRELFPDADVRLAGDGICLALAEHHVGGLRGVRNGLAMTVSSGIGGGLVVDGRVLRGATGNAGHVGHMVVPGRNDPCGCGGAGCVEAGAGGLASVRWARERGWGGATGAELARAARDGDPVARAVLERAGTALGQALASAAALLDLDSVVVGGGFAESGAPLWEPMRAAVAAHARLDFVRDLRIVPSRLGGDATLLGGGVLATDRFDDPGRPVP